MVSCYYSNIPGVIKRVAIVVGILDNLRIFDRDPRKTRGWTWFVIFQLNDAPLGAAIKKTV